jgi:hypothetical protein
MTHPSGPAGTGPGGGASTGPGRRGDRRLLLILHAVPVVLAAVLAIAVAIST